MFNSIKKKFSRKDSNRDGSSSVTSPTSLEYSGNRRTEHLTSSNPFYSASRRSETNEPPPAYSATPDSARRTAVPVTETADDKYAFLSEFDTIFLIDDSSSMTVKNMRGSRWDEVRDALKQIAPICTKRDQDGIDICFLNHPESPHHRNVTSEKTVIEIFQSVQPRGATPTGQKLEILLRKYMRRYRSDPDGTKPINIIVITDGEASDDVETPITKVAKELDKLDAPPWQVGIQFFQVGDNQAARMYLEELDNDLKSVSGGAIRDIVDTIPFKGRLSETGILKAVLGAVNKRIDRKSNDLHDFGSA